MQQQPGASEEPAKLDDDDDDVDDIPPPPKGSSVARHLVKTKETLFSPETAGFLQYYFHQAKHVLTNPKDFFEQMHQEGGVTEPLLFLGISAVIYGIIDAIGHLSPMLFFSSVFSSLFFTYVGSYIVNFALNALGGKGNQQSTFRVLAFSKATLLFAWINVATLAIGGYAALAYTIYLNIVGLKKVHGTSTGLTVAVTVVMALLGFALKKQTGW